MADLNNEERAQQHEELSDYEVSIINISFKLILACMLALMYVYMLIYALHISVVQSILTSTLLNITITIYFKYYYRSLIDILPFVVIAITISNLSILTVILLDLAGLLSLNNDVAYICAFISLILPFSIVTMCASFYIFN